MSTARPVTQWPLVLCGPMLRRVTRDEVCVFIALCEPALVRLELFAAAGGGDPTDPNPQTYRTLALGERLHVTVASFRPAPALATGTLYRYDLRITREDGVERTLASPDIDGGLLQGDFPLGYSNGVRPGFSLAPDRDSLNLLHTSCRKPHGEGPDMLALADDLLMSFPGPAERPHQLLLTGDQIYADDVALGLAQVIAATAPELLTSDTELRIPRSGILASDNAYHGELPEGPWTGEDLVGHAMNDSALAPGAERDEFSRDQAGMGSEYRSGHLLFLAEFYAMYLLTWSQALWPQDADGNPLVQPELAEDRPKQDELLCDAKEQTPRLIQYFRTLPKVRRALANIPTQMIFDDHEVSDDWNLDGGWVERVQGRAAGRQLLRNGLLAYALFQDWGNRPQFYADDPRAQDILDAVRCPQEPFDPAAPDGLQKAPDQLAPVLIRAGGGTRMILDQLFALVDTPNPALQMRWHYDIAFPSHQLIMLDVRTRRGFPNANAPAALIAPEQQVEQIAGPRVGHEDLIALVVSPVPMFDLPLTEDAKDLLGRVMDEFMDRETWAGNRAALGSLVDQLIPLSPAVVLSGDIHYAFTNHAAAVDEADRYGRIVQLCASSACHEDVKTRNRGLPSIFVPTRDLYLDGSFGEAVRDGLSQARVVAEGLGDAGAELAAELRSAEYRLSLLLKLTVVPGLPMDHWREAPGYEPIALLPPPEGTRCRIHHVRALDDGTSDALRPCPLPSSPAPAGTGGVPFLIHDHREVVGVDNLGQVTFGGNLVYHTLYWYSRNHKGKVEDLWCTGHQAPLIPPAPDEVPGGA